MDKVENTLVDLMECLARCEGIDPDSQQDILILMARLGDADAADYCSQFRNSEHHDHKEGEGVKWEPGVGAPPVGAKVKYPSGEGVVKLPPDRDGVIIVSERGEYKKVAASACERPKSHREKVIEAAHDFFMDKGSIPHRQTLGKAYDAGLLKLPEGEG